MSDEIRLSTFPDNEVEALALLYVKSLNLSGMSPEEMYDEYRNAYKKISNHKKEIRKQEQVSRQNISF